MALSIEVLATATVVANGDPAGTTTKREPSVTLLEQNRDNYTLGVIWMDRNTTQGVGAHVEQPCRLRGQIVVYNARLKTFSSSGPQFTVYQPGRWADGLGHSQGANAFVTDDDKWVVIFAEEDGDSGIIGGADSLVNLKSIYSTNYGQSWSSPVTLATSTLSIDPYRVCGSQESVVLPSGRRVITVYGLVGRLWCAYSDNDFISSCTLGSRVTCPDGYAPDETNIVRLSDGTLALSARGTSFEKPAGHHLRLWMTSANGESISWVGEQAGAVGPACMASLIRVGARIIHGAPSAPNAHRARFALKEIDPTTGAFGSEALPFAEAEYVGYSHMIRLPNGHVILAYEYHPTAEFNVNSSVGIKAIEIADVEEIVTPPTAGETQTTKNYWRQRTTTTRWRQPFKR